MIQRWEDLTFLHWRYPVDEVQRQLPPGLTVEPYDGSAWVGLVPFRLWVGLAVPVGRALSLGALGLFPETNVRTYVRDAEGRTGIWFFSLDAARLAAVVVGRRTFHLPYHWSSMRVERRGRTVRYTCRRRWPGPELPASRVAVEAGQRYHEGELGELDHWLTARWLLFGRAPTGSLLLVHAAHAPWPLHRGRVVELDDQLVTACGLPPPAGEPLVHMSPGVSSRIGPPHR